MLKAPISLTDFVDFTLRTGMPKLTKVREVMNREVYNPATDFWKPLRDGIVKFHREEKTIDFLDALATKQTDSKKLGRYPEVISAYKKFLGRKQIQWFDPPKSQWVMDDLAISINPELGLTIKDQPYIIKLFFKEDSINKRRSEIIFHLMEEELRSTAPEKAIMAVFDMKQGKLIPSKGSPENISIVLEAEAKTFMSIWNKL